MTLAEDLLGGPVEDVGVDALTVVLAEAEQLPLFDEAPTRPPPCRVVLIDGRPWGHGAVLVDTPGKGWPCPWCGGKAKKDGGRHVYLFGPPRCTPCAREWVENHWPPVVAEEKERAR